MRPSRSPAVDGDICGDEGRRSMILDTRPMTTTFSRGTAQRRVEDMRLVVLLCRVPEAARP
jgi:hypothetical protein